jgi:hypothetical protein
VRAGAGSLTPDLQPAPVNLDHSQCRACFDSGLERTGLKLFHLLIPLNLQLLTDLVGNMAGLPRTDS